MRPSFGDYILEQERKERRKRRLIILAVVLVLLVVLGVAAAIFWSKKDSFTSNGTVAKESTEQTAEQPVYYTQEELDASVAAAAENARKKASAEAMSGLKQYLTEGMSAVEAFRMIYPDDLIVASNGQYHFIPIREDLAHNDYVAENLQILETGEYQYMENGQVTSYKGIDISRFQGTVNWDEVAASGVQFAFIRVGNRGYGSGEIVEDTSFKRNIQRANAAGIKVGVYFFTQAINEEEILEEANFVLEKIASYQVDCPVVIDVEYIPNEEGRMDVLTAEERTALVKLFCDTIQNAGYKPMIYMNLEMAAVGFNYEELEAYDKWFSYYNPDFYFPYEYKVWQYSEGGTVAGVPEMVDLNLCFEPIWEQ